MDMMKKSTTIVATIAYEIAGLPEELISVSVAHTGPWCACRVAVVSPAFSIAADSDADRKCFLLLLVKGEPSPQPPPKKALFMRLSDGLVLLVDGLTLLQEPLLFVSKFCADVILDD